jgi:hypothetical protein
MKLAFDIMMFLCVAAGLYYIFTGRFEAGATCMAAVGLVGFVIDRN